MVVAGEEAFCPNSEMQAISLSLTARELLNPSVCMCVPLCPLQTAGPSGPSGLTATPLASRAALGSASLCFLWAASARATPQRAEPAGWTPTSYQVRSHQPAPLSIFKVSEPRHSTVPDCTVQIHELKQSLPLVSTRMLVYCVETMCLCRSGVYIKICPMATSVTVTAFCGSVPFYFVAENGYTQ